MPSLCLALELSGDVFGVTLFVWLMPSHVSYNQGRWELELMIFLTSIFIFTTFPLTCVICDKKISVKSTVNSELNSGTSLLCERYTLYLSLNDPFRFVWSRLPFFVRNCHSSHPWKSLWNWFMSALKHISDISFRPFKI